MHWWPRWWGTHQWKYITGMWDKQIYIKGERKNESGDFIVSRGTGLIFKKIYLQTRMCNPVMYRLMFFPCLWIFMQSILIHLEKCFYQSRDGNSCVTLFVGKQPKATLKLFPPGHLDTLYQLGAWFTDGDVLSSRQKKSKCKRFWLSKHLRYITQHRQLVQGEVM